MLNDRLSPADSDDTPSEFVSPDFILKDPENGLPEWCVSVGQVAYPDAVAAMEARVEAILKGEARELIWLIEHPPLYTAGVSAKREDLLEPDRFEVFDSARGGQFTYHGPGQRVIYVMLDLNRRTKDIRAFIKALEGWIIGTLWQFNVEGHIRDGRVGVWVERRDKSATPVPSEHLRGAPAAPEQRYQEDKIAAIGIKLRRWVSFHGISLNVEPDLSHFNGIVPCGISEHGVTSLIDLGLPVTMDEVDYALRQEFIARFGPVDNGSVL
ncbi:lipoyl(octanoyl) transferase LipB [Asticcacaulis excentricus]|uniref:Octanoyltransferase n=1 Tax=Asticcacaulis excentricus (strain ATCC 15261 / DSM 4724 / KCTC 12464 / NCIMB 9791 / VKM B-1370 / CB 48) TaxID=573065 RepID=E8RPG3_ASTEC|nr:lipoyl(octanoyl) transferase LipB [Asticcacaulis excentricus]ADU13061.1 lipoate-protein ligase B [Asticcacaulis excentricus CB 48]